MTIIVSTTASASARDYDWLLSALASWNGNRSDLAPLIPDFVMLAEKRLNADLEGRLQESVIPLPTTAGTRSIAIPADMAEIRSLSVPEHGPLDYLAPDQFNTLFAQDIAGTPRFYSVIGQAIYLGPTPDAAINIECSYRAFLPPLADSAGTNWLIEKYPNCYLAASMCEALAYTKNLAELPVWEKKYADAIDSVNKPDWVNGSSLQMRSDVRSV